MGLPKYLNRKKYEYTRLTLDISISFQMQVWRGVTQVKVGTDLIEDIMSGPLSASAGQKKPLHLLACCCTEGLGLGVANVAVPKHCKMGLWKRIGPPTASCVRERSLYRAAQ